MTTLARHRAPRIAGNSTLRWWWAITTTRLTRVWPIVVLIADIVISAVVATLTGLAAAVVGLGIFLGLHDEHGRPTWLAVGFLLAYFVGHLTVDWLTLSDPAREHRAQPLAQRRGGSNG